MTTHLLHVFPSFEIGGAQTRTAAWINGLGSRYRHTIVSLDGRLECAARLDETISAFYPSAPASGSLAGRIMAYRKLLRDTAPDLLLTNNWGSIEWAMAWRLDQACPLIHVESGVGPDEADQRLHRRNWMRRFVLRSPARIAVPSQGLRELAVDRWGLTPRRVRYIPDGIDCARFSGAPGMSLPALEAVRKGCVVGTVAVLRAEKNLGLLLQAFARLREDIEATLVIVGDGAERSGLENLADSLGLRDVVVFTGHMDNVEGVYPLFDIFALSSLTEQMPNSVLQAMAAGRPIAATRVGDLETMLSAENAELLVDSKGVDSLVGVLRNLAGDPALRARLGKANQEQVLAHFDLSRMNHAYESLLQEALTAV